VRTLAVGRTALALALGAAAIFAWRPEAQQLATSDGPGSSVGVTSILSPTVHPVVSRDVSTLWFAPQEPADTIRRAAPAAQLSAALKLVDEEKYGEALPLLGRLAGQPGPFGDYAAYYSALSQLRLGQHAEARDAFNRLQQRQAVGYLSEAAALAEAESAEALGDHAGAVTVYERLTAHKTSVPEEIWMRLAGAARAAGDLTKAADAFARVHFDFPLSALAEEAGKEYDALPETARTMSGPERALLELRRAERLFAGRRYGDARAAFLKAAASAIGDERELVRLRLAQCDYYLKRVRAARDGVKPFTGEGPRQAEALYFYALALRSLGDHTTYVRTVRRVADEFPGERWAEEALDNLGTHYILVDDEAHADGVFRELYARYPKGPYAERAAWKVGWRAYRLGRYTETIPMFESAAANFPRSNYRPGWLYWAGRAYEALGNRQLADDRYLLAAADYLNSYYGRLAAARLDGRMPSARVVSDRATELPPPPANEGVVRMLLSVSRYDDALNELRFAQRMWGDSPPIQATMAWIFRHQGQSRTGSDQFTLLRGSITLMRRAYPQFMAAGGEELPREVLLHIFPLDYWDLIRKHAALNRLDEYLVAALVAQESTFVPAVRSSAGAVGLMQLMPATARRMAQKLKMPYSRRLLTDPEANVRMGTAYLAEKMKEFGELHLALASYNAGERAVRRWLAERPDVADPQEFIDDIPYLETQNYVKRILGTVEDYRRLYGPSLRATQETAVPLPGATPLREGP
jgi:soluble lytic murein transglycosylase